MLALSYNIRYFGEIPRPTQEYCTTYHIMRYETTFKYTQKNEWQTRGYEGSNQSPKLHVCLRTSETETPNRTVDTAQVWFVGD